jgi:hypothetical protein
MNAPHVQLNDDGSVSVRLSPEEARIFASHDTLKVWVIQSRFREKLFVAQMADACRSEAVTG